MAGRAESSFRSLLQFFFYFFLPSSNFPVKEYCRGISEVIQAELQRKEQETGVSGGKKPRMLVKLLLVCSAVALAEPVQHADHHGHRDGSVHSLKPRGHESSEQPHRTPLPRQEGYWEAEGLREDTQDYPSSVISSHQEERGDLEAASPQPRNG